MGHEPIRRHPSPGRRRPPAPAAHGGAVGRRGAVRWSRRMTALRGTAILLLAIGTLQAQGQGENAHTAWEQIDLATFAVIDSSQGARLKTPVQPGSFMKLPTLIAALKAGVISPDTRIACPGSATIDGVTVRCSHP